MSRKDELKKALNDEMKTSEWVENLDIEWYRKIAPWLEKSRREALDLITTETKKFQKQRKKSALPDLPDSINVHQAARTAYEAWKKENPTPKSICPKVSAPELLLLIHRLRTRSMTNETEVDECLRRQNSSFETFWDSPSAILKALRQCVLTRDWDKMTHFLLLLLNCDKRYLPVVKTMCQVMVKFNPLITECGLEEEFQGIIDSSQKDATII